MPCLPFSPTLKEVVALGYNACENKDKTQDPINKATKIHESHAHGGLTETHAKGFIHCYYNRTIPGRPI